VLVLGWGNIEGVRTRFLGREAGVGLRAVFQIGLGIAVGAIYCVWLPDLHSSVCVGLGVAQSDFG